MSMTSTVDAREFTEPLYGDRHRLDPESLAGHAQRLYRAAYGLCGSRDEAEDLVQDAYERVLRRPRFVRREQDLAYLLRVLRNTWIRSLRAKKPVAYVGAADELDSLRVAHDPVAQAVDSRAVFEALQELTLPLREAVVAVDVLGLSYRDAARALKTKEGTIMSRLYRGRGQLAAQLPR
jgi:RNA polymerase sigma-70 factor, ECF subfamily